MTKPYIIKNDIGTYYYKDDSCATLHNDNGPAYEHKSGYKSWYVNGKLYRIDGLAIEFPDGTTAWFLNDKECSEEEHKRLVKMINFL